MIDRAVGTITKGGQEVNVVEVSGMKGYRFDAVGRWSLPLATDLAIKQARGELKLKGEKNGH